MLITRWRHLNPSAEIINVNSTSIFYVVTLLLLATVVSAASVPPEMTEIWNLNDGIKQVGAALGMLVIAHAGLRWVTAESPQDRDDAKKTIIYVMMGLFVVSQTKLIVDAVYCYTLESTTYGGGVC